MNRNELNSAQVKVPWEGHPTHDANYESTIQWVNLCGLRLNRPRININKCNNIIMRCVIYDFQLID